MVSKGAIMIPNAIAVGDVVSLNSDPTAPMTVEKVEEDGQVLCTWVNVKLNIQFMHFDARTLSIAEPYMKRVDPDESWRGS
jgi:uncharacterized protein YodC (DUF2158 family)